MPPAHDPQPRAASPLPPGRTPRWRWRAWVFGLAAISGAALAGCAPISAAPLDAARDAVEAARAAGADAPGGPAAYAWWSATGYLEAARRAAGHADHSGAERFARRARAFADEARALAAAARPPSPAVSP